jgi:energy-coupling factor transport system permease protein
VILGFVAGNGILHRLHPFTGLSLAAAVVVLALALPAPQGAVGLAAALVIVAFVAGLPRVLVTVAAFAAPFWLFLFLIHVVFGDDPLRALTVGGQITAILLGFLLVLASVHPARLVDALLEARVPFAVAYLLAATLQSVPRLQARAGAILDAQRCRGLAVQGSLWRRARAVVPLAVPLVLGALAEVDQRAFALDSRGMGARVRRTPLAPPRDSVLDGSIRWSLLILSLGVIALRVIA